MFISERADHALLPFEPRAVRWVANTVSKKAIVSTAYLKRGIGSLLLIACAVAWIIVFARRSFGSTPLAVSVITVPALVFGSLALDQFLFCAPTLRRAPQILIVTLVFWVLLRIFRRNEVGPTKFWAMLGAFFSLTAAAAALFGFGARGVFVAVMTLPLCLLAAALSQVLKAQPEGRAALVSTLTFGYGLATAMPILL